MSEPIHPSTGAMRARRARRPPGPRTLSPLANAAALQRDPIRFAQDIWQRYGDIVHFRFLFWPAYVLYHPDQVKRVLQENHRTYSKNFPMMKAAQPTNCATRLLKS
jgi:enediyne biosynthesis protein E7